MNDYEILTLVQSEVRRAIQMVRLRVRPPLIERARYKLLGTYMRLRKRAWQLIFRCMTEDQHRAFIFKQHKIGRAHV